MCKAEVWGSGPQTDKPLPQNPFTGQKVWWRHFALLLWVLSFLRFSPLNKGLLPNPANKTASWTTTFMKVVVALSFFFSPYRRNKGSVRRRRGLWTSSLLCRSFSPLTGVIRAGWGGEEAGQSGETGNLELLRAPVNHLLTRSQIHERTLSLRFLGVILRIFSDLRFP